MSYSARNKPPSHKIDISKLLNHRAEMINYLLYTCGYEVGRIVDLVATDMIAVVRFESECRGTLKPKD